jgi:hypothetical protein
VITNIISLEKPQKPEVAGLSGRRKRYSKEQNFINNILQGCVKESEKAKLL